MFERLKKIITRNKSSNVLFMFSDNDDISIPGYIPLSKNAEVQTAVNYIADLVSSMTVYLMENSENGDKRVKDHLALKLDVAPNNMMTRKTFIYTIVKQMLLNGNAIVYPQYSRESLLENLEFLPDATIESDKYSYTVRNGQITYQPNEILNFICNPSLKNKGKGCGYTVELREIVQNLAQAQKTKKEFMSSKYRPSLVVKVDGNAEEMASPEGRDALAKKYLSVSSAGQPWIIPADFMDVKEIKPLSLKDIAINESVEIDKKTVARIIGVPNYVVGVGDFNKEEHRHFISTKIKSIAEIISQEMTSKLILSDKRYVMFSPKSLYGYDLKEISEVSTNLYVRGLMMGNEVRDWHNLSPLDGLDKLVILENYIPADMIGNQKKLKGDDETNVQK